VDNTASGTAQKALKLNLDAITYGTFAEIGAGQEVARWFFSVGGAAGTVAKTGSAYDMAVSDALYGPDPALREPAAPGGHARTRVRSVTGSSGAGSRRSSRPRTSSAGVPGRTCQRHERSGGSHAQPVSSSLRGGAGAYKVLRVTAAELVYVDEGKTTVAKRAKVAWAGGRRSPTLAG
jgi:hypothetical protein